MDQATSPFRSRPGTADARGDRPGRGALSKVADPDFAEPRPVARSFEAEQIRAQYADDEHAAAVALEALAQLDQTVARLELEIPALQERGEEFLHDALIEHATETLAQPYVERIAAFQQTTASLLGLNVVVRGRRAFRSPYVENAVDVNLPMFGLPGIPGDRDEVVRLNEPLRPALTVTQQDAERAAEP